MSARSGRHLVQVVLAVVVLSGGLLVEHVEGQSLAVRPFVSTGVVGEPVAAGAGTVVVHRARAATELADGLGGLLTTSGVWVAVDLSLTGRDGPATLGALHLQDATGRQFAASRRVSLNGLGRAQPGSPIRGEVLFEVPRDAVEQVTLIASELLGPLLSGTARVPVPVELVQGPLVRAATTLGDPR